MFNRRFHFFQKLIFKKISVILSVEIQVEILKNKSKPHDLLFVFYKEKELIENFKFSLEITDNLLSIIDGQPLLFRVSETEWFNEHTEELLSIEEIVDTYRGVLPKNSNINKIQTIEATNILNSLKIHLIKEHRLHKEILQPKKLFFPHPYDKDQSVIKETIQTYAQDLKEVITQTLQELFVVSQNLDSSYPNRLVSKEDYDERFASLKKKQDKLTGYGLYETNQEVLSYSKDDSKALLVYLNDLERKLSVFDDLLEKLELFTSILNERRFTHKTISIDKEKGFYFKTSKGKKLKLNQLSSGEQHEVVLLYELIFKTKPGILVLIDEPEISLHITWQKEFLDDLLKIIKIQNFQVLIATHSPSIINDRWDLVYNLEKEPHYA